MKHKDDILKIKPFQTITYNLWNVLFNTLNSHCTIGFTKHWWIRLVFILYLPICLRLNYYLSGTFEISTILESNIVIFIKVLKI